jgi:hypothetical protein
MGAALSVVVSLTGCAGLSADVQAGGPVNAAVVLRSGSTYTFARMPLQEESAAQGRLETLLRDELAKRGFTDAAGDAAQYRLSIAYDTRPTKIDVSTKDCARGACEPAPAAPFALFGTRYRHALTLRFFDLASGEERYKVSAALVDRDADPLHAMPALVMSALAKFPFDAPPDWRVKLRMDPGGERAEVVSVKPLQR